MKKVQVSSILLLTILLINFSSALNLTGTTTNITKTGNNSNPIIAFMQGEVTSQTFKIIGAPEKLTHQNLIIYLLFIFIAYIILIDLLNGINLFGKKWITSAISLIVILLGIYSGTMYNFITNVVKFGFGSAYLATITPYIAIVIIAAYLVIRLLVKIIKRSNGLDKEKAEAFGDKMKTLKKVREIEMKAEGIE